MSREEPVIFSAPLLREQHIHLHLWCRRLRACALLLTVGEVLVAYFMFRRTDFLGAYAMGAYLAKEHVIAKIVGRFE